MRRSVINLINEAKHKMSGYLGLYTYRLMNLCVKAEPASLLSIELQEGDTTIGLENLAEVGQTDDYHFVIIPKDRSILNEIIKAMVTVHPEFEYEIKKVDPNSSDDDEDADLYLYLSMPKVNEDRRDVMNDAVEVLYTECKSKCDLVYDKYLAEIAEKLLYAPEDEKKQGKEQMEQLHDKVDDLMKAYKEKKLSEIEEGYKRYLQEREEKEKKQQSEEKAHGRTAGMSMKLYGEEDDE